jgi:UDP-N-acetylmuramoyl-tripeptide--D-alanyl-D-alanine ligase
MDISILYQLYLKHPVICTDTRNIIPGSIFFALKGPNFNANSFAVQAIEKGCSYAVVDDNSLSDVPRVMVTDDVLATLQELARHHRQQMPAIVLALTGSNGKTTTKELLNAVLSSRFTCLATEGNLNNHIGVPLTLLKLQRAHEVAIIEMGANHQGEIHDLCNIALPELGLITNIGKAHLEGFGGIQGVVKGKTEMYRHLASRGKRILLNADDDVLVREAGDIEAITYGTSEKAQIQGRMTSHSAEMQFEFKTTGQWIPVQTHLTGSYNFYNALAAVAAAHIAGISDVEIKDKLEDYIPSNNRSQIEKRGTNTLILDAYNANPSSMALAIDNASSLPFENKLFLLGDMREMGTYAADEHTAILEKLQHVKATCVLVGSEFFALRKNYPYLFFENTESALEWLRQHKPANALVLLKGSRGVRLEKLLEAL